MKTQVKSIAPELLLREYSRILREKPDTKDLPLLISGNSMSPFLIHHRDTVYLSALTRPPRRGDIVLYQRRDGQYVLHRVYSLQGDTCTMLGDAQTQLEPGIGLHQIRAIVTGVRRKGKLLTPDSFWWLFFERIWIRIRPVRRPIHRLYTLLMRHSLPAESRQPESDG